MIKLRGTVMAMAGGIALALALGSVQAAAFPRVSGEVVQSGSGVELVWNKKTQGIHCKTPKKSCTFEDGKPRRLGAACICKSQPKIQGKVTP